MLVLQGAPDWLARTRRFPRRSRLSGLKVELVYAGAAVVAYPSLFTTQVPDCDTDVGPETVTVPDTTQGEDPWLAKVRRFPSVSRLKLEKDPEE
jgi:hypothetical protein